MMENSCLETGNDILLHLEADKNLVYSPLSIFAALAMTLSGANGSTEDAIMNVLHWDTNNILEYHKELSETMKKVKIDVDGKNLNQSSLFKVANRLYLEDSFTLLKEFTNFQQIHYNGGLEKVQFNLEAEKSRLKINSWVENETNSKIKDLLDSSAITSLTKLIIVNCLYFKGPWIDKFNDVGDKPFNGISGLSSNIPSMTRNKKGFVFRDDNNKFSATFISFHGDGNNNSYSMYIVLPDKEVSLNSLEKTLVNGKLMKSVFDTANYKGCNVNLQLPKFRIEYDIKLKSLLSRLGMSIAFNDQQADFSKMTGNRDLKIDDVIHKAFIEIDENGAEAAAATAVMMCCRALVLPIETTDFICDRPFLYYLVLNESLPLFAGHFVG